MTSRRDLALGCALVASLIGNLYLVARGVPGGRVPTPPSPEPRPMVAAGPRIPSFLPADIDQSRPCADQLSVVQGRLAASRPALQARLSPQERFAGGNPDAASTSTVRAMTADVFGDAPVGFTHAIECRDRVCRVTVDLGTTDYDWVDRLQDPDYRPLFEALAFESTGAAYLQLR